MTRTYYTEGRLTHTHTHTYSATHCRRKRKKNTEEKQMSKSDIHLISAQEIQELLKSRMGIFLCAVLQNAAELS